MISFLRKIAIALFACTALALPLSAQNHPMPGKDTSPPVVCTGCPDSNASGELNSGKPTFPFSAPLMRHVGRLVDSSNTQDVQNVGIRTIRAGLIRTAPMQRGGAPPRVYIQLGGAIGAYSLSSFFTTKLAGGMVPATQMGALPFGAQGIGRGRPLYEKVNVPDAWVYAENGTSGFTNDVCPNPPKNPKEGPGPGEPETAPSTPYCDEGVGDRQEVLYDFDFDDRGYIYPAYGVFGWAPVRDDGTTGGGQFARVAQTQQVVTSTQVIVSLKVGQKYYVVTGAGDFNGHRIYDITNPSPAVAPPKVVDHVGDQHMIISSAAVALWSKNDTAKHFAYIDRSFKLRVYDYASFVSGAPALKVETSDKGFIALSYDESGNLWAAEKGARLWKFTPSGSTYVATTYDLYGGAFLPEIMHAAGGYVVVGGTDGQSIDIRLIKAKGTPQLVDLKQFFRKFYHRAPSGYAQPPRGYLGFLRGVQLIEHGGKTYLIYTAHGMGDVYEIEGGEGITATMKTTTFGTVNANAKSTEAGPFHGDLVTFRAASNNAQANYQVEWDFGNPESGSSNLVVTNLATDTTHQYTGIATAAAIGTLRQIKANAFNDPSVSTSLPLTLKVPVPRIGLPNGTALSALTTPGVALVVGDSFTDASDGSVEGHFGTWTIDGTPTLRLPNGSTSVGAVGAHTLAFTGTYGRYDAPTFTPGANPYVTPTLNVTYTALPFLFTLNNPSKTTVVRFGATARKTSDTALMSATTWTCTWTLKNGDTDLVPQQTGSAAVGTIPNFDVPLTTVIPSGSVVKLVVTVDPSGLSAPAQPYATYSQELTLSIPNPNITITGCANALSPCTFTAVSLGGQSPSDWTLAWELKNALGAVVAGGATNPLAGPIAAPGTYTIVLTAKKTIFEAKVEKTVIVAGTLCGPPPTVDQLAISVSCSNCVPNQTITFRASVVGYQKQTCDTWSWSFGDGGTATGDPATHQYASGGNFTVRLTATNPNDSTFVVTTVTVTGSNPDPDPPPTCTKPASILFSYFGNKGCAPGVACKTGESIKFTAFRGTSGLIGCDTASWQFGDNTNSSTKSPAKTYSAAGTYNVKVTIKNSAGEAAFTDSLTVVTDGPVSTCSKTPTDADFYYDFVGAESGCTGTNGRECKKGESIQFTTKGYLYVFQECDKFEWTFGDGTTSTVKSPAHTFAGSAASYTVGLRVWNQNRPEGYTFSTAVPFDGAPVLETPVLTYTTFPTTGAKDQTITFAATSNLSATGWTWNFGDGTSDNSQRTVTSTTSTITHKFTRAGAFDVSVSARNAEDVATAPTSSRINRITVSDLVLHRFMIPVAVHGLGDAGSVWRTDIQIYHPTASPTVPLQMKASFQGAEYDLEIKQSTFIYEDFIKSLIGNQNTSGPIVISTLAPTPPQIWSRTYNVDPSGRTFGQFIPAVYLNTGGAAAATAAQPKYHLAGLRQDSKFRTNVGFVNPTLTDLTVNVLVFDDIRNPIASFSLTLAPFQLMQFRLDIPPNRDPLTLPARPLSLEISVPQGQWVIAYASRIAPVSNDPEYIQAVWDGDVISEDYREIVLPGVGRIGDWKSDITIFNPDVMVTTFDLEYFDNLGVSRGVARGVTIPPMYFTSTEDLLRAANLLTPPPPDSVGSLRIKTTTPAGFTTNRFPIAFARTYNDRGTDGTFGQGINSFSAARANVKPGKKAIIPAVRSNASYYTNIGVTNVTATPVTATVKLLDPNTGLVAKEQAIALSAYQSVVGRYDFGTLETGTFEVSISGTQGAVWAFASVVDKKSFDPEYVPAVPLP